jgi:hypothetical protein
MTNEDKKDLRQLCKAGYSFEQIKGMVECADSTIKSYLKVFSPNMANYEHNINYKKKEEK